MTRFKFLGEMFCDTHGSKGRKSGENGGGRHTLENDQQQRLVTETQKVTGQPSGEARCRKCSSFMSIFSCESNHTLYSQS